MPERSAARWPRHVQHVQDVVELLDGQRPVLHVPAFEHYRADGLAFGQGLLGDRRRLLVVELRNVAPDVTAMIDIKTLPVPTTAMIVSNTATGTNEIMARSGHCALGDRAASDRDRELADHRGQTLRY